MQIAKAVNVEPVKDPQWPANFFENIRIDDPEFGRPQQGETPPAPSFDHGHCHGTE